MMYSLLIVFLLGLCVCVCVCVLLWLWDFIAVYIRSNPRSIEHTVGNSGVPLCPSWHDIRCDVCGINQPEGRR